MHEMLLNHKELFKKLNELENKFAEHDDKIQVIFEYLKQFEQSKQEELDFKKRRKIGFNRDDDE